MNYAKTEEKVYAWGRNNQPTVKEIYVIGSRATGQTSEKNLKKSDLDLIIFLDTILSLDVYYSTLADIGLEEGVLIHPLFILEKDRKSKLSIKEYADALAKGRKLL